MINGKVDNGKTFDFGKTSQQYAKYRDIYPKELFCKLYDMGVGHSGTRWLDMGTGTGVLVRAMHIYGADIYACDISENQIEYAKKLSANINNITYKSCPAEHTGYNDNMFDSVTACQCFWYFDPKSTVNEIKRIIKPGGMFVKIFMDWDENDEIASFSSNLVKQLNPDWNSGAAALKDLQIHYFNNPITEVFTCDIHFTRDLWHGRMLSCRGVMASMNDDVLKCFNERHIEYMNSLPPEFTVKHKIYLTSYKIEK